jgi:hypothetical protein
MIPKTIGGVVVVTGAVVGGLLARRGRPRRADPRRWLAVTVNRAPSDVLTDGNPPAPLAELGEAIEVQVRPAPGDRGAELAARLRDPSRIGWRGPAAKLHGDEPLQKLRTALRQAKAILEVGEVVLPDAPRTTHPGGGGRLVAAADRVAQGEGRL